MPISRERAREIVERNVGGREPLTIKQGLSPVSPDDRPLPPRVPAGQDWSAAGQKERREFLAARGVAIAALSGEAQLPDPESLRGNIEHFIGMAAVPVRIARTLTERRVSGMSES